MFQKNSYPYRSGAILIILFHLISCTTYRPFATDNNQIASAQFESNKRYQIVLTNDKIAVYGKEIKIIGDQIEITTRFTRSPKIQQFPLSQVEKINVAKFSTGKTIGLAGGILATLGTIFIIVILSQWPESD